MESENPDKQEQPAQEAVSHLNKIHVYTERNWKEYLGESLLIVFSVLLALFLTEYISKQHEKENTKSILKGIIVELKHNKVAIQEMQEYNLKVLAKIDSVLINKKLQDDLVSNEEFHLKIIAPQGVLFRFLDNEAWTIAKNNNIMSKIDFESASVLAKVYEHQDRISKVEDEVAKIIFDRESRDPNKVHATLILIRDVYHGWAVDRVPGLLQKIDSAINKTVVYN
jgi:hypothetical protein